MGVDLINYTGDVRTSTEDITTAKLIIRSTISTPGVSYILFDIKNYSLGTILIQYEYINMSMDILPEENIQEYNFMYLADNGYVYCEIL